jgi:uncharacterized protein involved in outer membrane biogenesis
MSAGANGFLSKSKARYKTLPRWGKIVLYVAAAFLLLLIAGWIVAAWYINSHKKELLHKITSSVSEQIDGNFQIKDMEPALLTGFPHISVRLKDVSLSDSMYQHHKKNLLELKSVYVQINVLSLLTRHPKVGKITIADGAVYLFADTRGYTNTYLFKKKNPEQKKKAGKQIEIREFGIENVLFTFDHFERNKQFKVRIDDMDGEIDTRGEMLDIEADTKAHFYQLGFNLEKGGFVKNKDLDAHLKFHFNKKNSRLEMPVQRIEVNDVPINFGCVFNFGNKPADYQIDIDAPSIYFKEGTSYLSRAIAEKLDSFDLDKRISVQVKVNGSFQYPDTPLVDARWQTKNNVLHSAFGKMVNTQLKGSFVNNYVPGRGRGDDNSAVTITGLTANYAEIPFRADSIVIYGLINPLMKLKLVTRFEVEKLNAILDNSFDMKGGFADIDLNYTGPVLSHDTFRHTMYGHIRIKDAALTYVPRSLSFKKCNINIEFDGNNLMLRNTTLSSMKSTIKMEGNATNFMNVYFLDPGRVRFDWNISSNLIDLNEYKTFLAPRKKKAAPAKPINKNHKMSKIADRLELVMEKSTMFLHVNVGRVLYDKFDAQHINADIDITESGIGLKNVRLQHAGGSLHADARLYNGAATLPFDIHAKVNKVKVSRLFYAFENFGQQTLSHKNLEGDFSADIKVRGVMNEQGHIFTNTLNGNIAFQLDNGELNNFPPFESIQKFVFKKRNLSHITFNTLKNNLDINNGKITIHPMSIESSALTIKVEGVYAFEKGTDISIAIPLRNPQKDRDLIAQGKKPRKDKGIVVYLRAQDGDDGKVGISWDPLKKGLKDSTRTDDDDEADKAGLPAKVKMP